MTIKLHFLAIALAGALSLILARADAQSCSGQPSANTVCAGPTTGGGGLPAFRALVNGDLPVAATSPIFPENGTTVLSGHTLCFLDQDCQWSGPYLGWVSNMPIIIGKSPSTIASSTPGQIFSLRFQWAANDITISYTAVGGDTTTTIATALTNLVNANATIRNPATGLPIFTQAIGGGNFNLQWSYGISLTVTSTGTGSITLPATDNSLDFTIFQMGRTSAGKTLQAVENLIAFDFTGPDSGSSGGLSTHYGQLTVTTTNTTSGAQAGQFAFNTANNGTNSLHRVAINRGLFLYDSAGAPPTGGDQGAGTINIPATGSYNVAGAQLAVATGTFAVGNNLFGGVAVGSALNLQSTQNGSPSGDFVQVTAGGVVRQKWFSGGGLSVGGAADPGAPGIINLLTGIRIGNAAASANVLRGNGTNFVSAQLAAADLSNSTSGSGAVCLVTSCNMVTPVLGVAAATNVTASNGLANGFILTAAAGTNGALAMGAGGALIFTMGSTVDTFAVNDHLGNTVLNIVESTPGTQASTTMSFLGTAQATSPTTGAVTTTGGLGVTKAIYAGNEIVTGIATVAGLPTCNSAHQGAHYFVTDSNAASYTAGIGAIVAAGGATKVPVTCDGTNWRIG